MAVICKRILGLEVCLVVVCEFVIFLLLMLDYTNHHDY